MSTETVSATDLMLRIKAIDPTAVLKLSEWTRKWYIEAKIELSDGVLLTGITEHRDSPELAVRAFFDRLIDVPIDEAIVTNAYHDKRRNWRWNGAAFTEVPAPHPRGIKGP